MKAVGVVAAVVLLLPGATAFAKPEYTRKTSRGCAFCHQPPGYNLNDAGKYYAEHKTLKGYKQAPKPKASH